MNVALKWQLYHKLGYGGLGIKWKKPQQFRAEGVEIYMEVSCHLTGCKKKNKLCRNFLIANVEKCVDCAEKTKDNVEIS